MKLEVNISKKYFFILASILVLGFLAVGVSSYGGSNPSVMGHSGGEVMLDSDTVVDDGFCNKIMGHACGYDDGGTGVVNDLVYGMHSSEQCLAIGGVVMTDDPDGSYCKLPGTCSGYGWAQFKFWRQTKATTCKFRACLSSCSTGASWKNSASFDTCTYKSGDVMGAMCAISTTCTATATHRGCY